MREERRRMKRAQKKRQDFANRRAERAAGAKPGFAPGRHQRSEFFQEQATVDPPQPLPTVTSARQLAFHVLEEHSESGQFIGQLMEGVLKQTHLSHPAERRLATELANGIVRRQLTLDAILKTFVDRPPDQVEPRLRTLLRLGAYQLVLASGIKSHAAVAETVELARWCGEERWCGFLNGVLRSIDRSVEAAAETSDTDGIVTAHSPKAVPLDLETADAHSPDAGEQRYRLLDREVFPGLHDIPRYISAAFGLPLWLVIRWERRLDRERLFRLASTFNFRTPLTLRVNPLRTSREELLALLREHAEQQASETPEPEQNSSDLNGVSATAENVADGQSTAAESEHQSSSPRRAVFGEGRLPNTIWCRAAGNPATLPGFAAGLFTVQDETAMSAVALLDPEPGQNVLDLCAAPGTKSTHMAELMNNDGSILAADSDAVRLERVSQNARRLGLDIISTVTVQDDLSDLPQGPFDAILVDAVCSNTGVLAKRPEVRTRLRRADVEELAGLQLKLLTAAAARLVPGGRLVYSTCSIEPEENSGVIAQFLECTPDIRLEETREFFPGEPSDGGFQTLMIRGG